MGEQRRREIKEVVTLSEIINYTDKFCVCYRDKTGMDWNYCPYCGKPLLKYDISSTSGTYADDIHWTCTAGGGDAAGP